MADRSSRKRKKGVGAALMRGLRWGSGSVARSHREMMVMGMTLRIEGEERTVLLLDAAI
jgi:hypothetical protein